MGNCQAFYVQGISRLKGKVAVFGFGIVVHKEEVKVPGPNNGTQTNLHVTLRHHDYQNLSKEMVSFDTVYVVPGNVILGSTHSKFAIGNKAIIVGYVNSFVHRSNYFVVQAILLSVSYGPQNLASSVSGAASGPSTRGIRPVMKCITGSNNTASTQSVISVSSGGQSSKPSTPTIGGRPQPFTPGHGSVAATPKASNTSPKASYSVKSSSKPVEDGEVLENNDVFVNTFPKDKGQNKRPADSSPTATPTGLSDSQKRFKQSRQ
ncbi:hypothetical protein PCANC_16472 [Puccinia coronata f. sp. avenae]|uniref:Uncharacterized protein n=2 Tax=Puccinia coronata f. sp. avenae TaxID=200324 RepID=A0A2N5SRU3_9BASI|nr:hypothetical protein PCANC_16472 [Puccinia coronata f. sp. avenae]